MTSRDEVVDFLYQFKSCLLLGQSFCLVKGRPENRQGLIDLGLTPDDRQELLMGLVPEDYNSGPMPDDTDATKDVWVFGKEVEGTEVYIKLRIATDPRRKGVFRAMVWSFHPAEFPMKYPLRGEGL